MFRTRRIVFASALFSIGAAVAWAIFRTDPAATPGLSSTEVTLPSAIAPEGSIVEGPAEASQPIDNCLTPEQLDTHPLLISDALQFEPLFVSGPSIEAFRGLSESDVLSLAAQNDSAAMAVLGAMAMLRAKSLDEQKAVDFLVISETNVMQEIWRAKPGANAAIEYQTAYDWFYKSALHGRLMALSYAGEALAATEPSLVKRNLIAEEEYEALTRQQRSLLNLMNIYTAAAADVAGNPEDGILGILFGIMPRSDALNAMAADIAQQYHDDVVAAGLPQLVIPKSEMPPIEEVMMMVCEQFRPSHPTEAKQ